MKYLFTLVFFLLSIPLFSQKIILSGKVKDSLNVPLSYANIIAKPRDLNQNLSFAITDELGDYRLKLEKDKTYTISISFMGYKQMNFTLTPTEDSIKDFFLNEVDNQLEEVVVELPVTVKVDTIIYKTKHFVTGEERKLKNVLKKLPGVEIDKNGDITVQGKKVTKMLVDGKKFFGGGTKLAVDNIPADAVDKVEVLDNYNEVAFLKNLSDSDEMAMNIHLKEEKKRFVFGDIGIGKGNENFYKTQTNLFYYSPKTNINFIGNLNDIGEQTFTFQDYLSFSGGVNSVFNSEFNFKGSGFSHFLQTKDLVSSQQKFGAINITKTTSEKLDISGYAIFSHTNTENLLQTINQYPQFKENRVTKNRVKNVLGIGRLNIEYAPNFQEQWYVRSQFKKNSHYKNNSIVFESNTLGNSVFTNVSDGAQYTNQNIEWHKKKSQKHTFSTTINYTFDKNNPTAFWSMKEPVLQGLTPLDTVQKNLMLRQLSRNEKHYLYSVFKEFWVINDDNHIYSTFGNSYQYSRFSNSDSQILDDNSEKSFSFDGFNNKTTFKLNDFFLGLHYKFRTGIFTFKQGGYIHKYDWVVNQQNSLQNNKWVFLPDFLLKIEFSKSKKLQLNYNLQSNFSEASKLANRFYLQTYNSVFKGNETLENELFHNARIRYSRFSLYKGILLTASASYTKKVKGWRNAVDFDGINQFLTIQMLENPSENWGINTSIRKKIRNIRYKLSGNYLNSKYLQSVNRDLLINKNENYSFNVGAETIFDNYPNMEIGFKRSVGNFTSNSSTSQFITNEPYLNINYDFLKGFIFSFDYIHYNYQNKQQNLKNIYNISNATLSYRKEDSPWNFKIEAQNLLNTKYKLSNRFSDYLISDTKTFILPRIVMFSIGYNL